MITNLKFRFTEFGPVEEARLELGDLTVIAGRNNTGKTYLVYALYGFLKGFGELMVRAVESPYLDAHINKVTSLSAEEIVTKLTKDSRLEWKYERKEVNQLQSQLIMEMCKRYSRFGVPRVFNASSDYFKESSIGLEFSTDLNVDQPIGFSVEKGLLSCSFDGSKFVITLKHDSPDDMFEADFNLTYHGLKLIFIHTLFGGSVFSRSINSSPFVGTAIYLSFLQRTRLCKKSSSALTAGSGGRPEW